MTKKASQSGIHLFEGWTFTKRNYILFGIGVFTIIAGYIVMASGDVNSFRSLTLAPILLFLGYVIIIPVALIYRDKSNRPAGKSERSKVSENKSLGS